ncbi:MAG: DedA family protein [Desulfobacteraceae bacterium]|jgi:membrane protein DedA with SNARE-associated domain
MIENQIDTYGYLAILIGTFLEGETILVLGGFAAHRGYLHLPWVILMAFIGSLLGDQLFFFLGRWRSQVFLARHPVWNVRIEKVHRLLERYRTPLILMFRFLYGLRTVIPFVIGTSTVPTVRFIFLNALGAAVWAASVGAGGYLFGSALELFIGNIKQLEVYAFGLIAVIGGFIWAGHFLRRRRSRHQFMISKRDLK